MEGRGARDVNRHVAVRRSRQLLANGAAEAEHFAGIDGGTNGEGRRGQHVALRCEEERHGTSVAAQNLSETSSPHTMMSEELASKYPCLWFTRNALTGYREYLAEQPKYPLRPASFLWLKKKPKR